MARDASPRGATTARVLRCWSTMLSVAGYFTLLGVCALVYTQRALTACTVSLAVNGAASVVLGNLACTWFHSHEKFVVLLVVVQLAAIPAQFTVALMAALLAFASPPPSFIPSYFATEAGATSETDASLGLGIFICSVGVLVVQIGALLAAFAQVLELHHFVGGAVSAGREYRAVFKGKS